jgi:ubiquinone biosynthesis protein COQ4
MVNGVERLRLLAEAFAAMRAGRTGDAAALKAAALGARARPALQVRLQALDAPFPDMEAAVLHGAPPGSFGAALAAFLDAHRLSPLRVSSEVARRLGAESILGVRYAILHDAFHVLLGFDASLPGELGVWSFVSAQRYGPAFDRAAAFAGATYPLRAPTRRAALRRAAAAGAASGRAARCLIAEPLHRFGALPLADARRRCGLPADGAIGSA